VVVSVLSRVKGQVNFKVEPLCIHALMTSIHELPRKCV